MTGFKGPDSLMTIDPDEVLRFVSTHAGAVIYKGASAYKTIVRNWRDEGRERLPYLVAAPVLFQRRIVGPDVRVHLVGERVFGERIDSVAVDYRFERGRGVRYKQIDVPVQVRRGCIRHLCFSVCQ